MATLVRRAAPAAVLFLLVAACSSPDVSSPVAPGEPSLAVTDGGADGDFLVLASAPTLPPGLAGAVARAGGTVAREIPEVGIVSVTSSDPGFAARAARIRGVRSVVPDPTIPWIPELRRQSFDFDAAGDPPASGDDDFFFDLQWGHDAVDAPEAWDAGARGAGARVAVLDAGIDATHPDLAPNLNPALSTSFVPGEAFDDVLPFPSFSHGSHVSGTVAAADNAFGTIGVAPEAELVMVKVLSAVTGSGSFAGVIEGIVYAANIDADVINMSLGAQLSGRGEVFDPNTGEVVAVVPAEAVAELRAAIGRATSFAHASGTTVIAAAGNAAKNGDRDRDIFVLPADAPNVVAIAATGPLGWAVDPGTNLDERAFFTNFGRSTIDFAAPGGNVDFGLLASGDACTVGATLPFTAPCWVFDLVFSTDSGGWSWAGGTSMATPHATGVAAVIVGHHGGDLHPDRVEAELRRAADDLGQPGRDALGLGRVNAGNAVR